nr:MAG TPA: hypothetical protein [Caudoviricetes sp.]
MRINSLLSCEIVVELSYMIYISSVADCLQ